MIERCGVCVCVCARARAWCFSLERSRQHGDTISVFTVVESRLLHAVIELTICPHSATVERFSFSNFLFPILVLVYSQTDFAEIVTFFPDGPKLIRC